MLIFSICTVKTYLPRKQLYYTSHVPGVREHDRHEVCAERLVSAALLFAQDVDLKTKSLNDWLVCEVGQSCWTDVYGFKIHPPELWSSGVAGWILVCTSPCLSWHPPSSDREPERPCYRLPPPVLETDGTSRYLRERARNTENQSDSWISV